MDQAQTPSATPVREWLINTLEQHRHLPRHKIIALGTAAGHSRAAIDDAARTIGVSAHRSGRDSEWYAPTADTPDFGHIATKDPEFAVISFLNGGTRRRADVLQDAEQSGYGRIAVIGAAKRLRVVATRENRGRGGHVLWTLADSQAAEIEAWKSRQKLSPL